MDVSVQEVDIPSEDGTQRKYFLRVDWGGRDLGSGFHILLTDGQLAWRGEEELEMQKEKYIQDLCQALTGTESSVTYNFTLTPQPAPTNTTSTTTTTLAYEKVQKDISFRLGSVELGAVVEPVEAVRELLELGVQTASRLERRNRHLQEENYSLSVDQKHITVELQHYAEGKQVLEAELYSRFVLVLNDKKKRIRSLQQSLTQLQQNKSSEKQSKATPSQSQASHQEANSEDEYGGSTEEDEEEEGRVDQAAGPATVTSASLEADSECLLDDELNDITDVAPCRKRRIRNIASTSGPVAKRGLQQTSTRHKRDSPAGGAAADNQKTLRQQCSKDPATSPMAADLFDDF